MDRTIRLTFILGIILLAGNIGLGCKGGEVPNIGNISGPNALDESTTGVFTMSIQATGVTFEWTCDPSPAGYFIGASGPKTTFKAGKIKKNTTIEIRVLVNSDQYGPVLKTKQVLVRDVNILSASEIEGPTEFYADTITTYSVEAWGDTGITYSWSCDPPGLGEFSNTESPSTKFTAFEVDEDTNVEIRVDIGADFYNPIYRTIDVTIMRPNIPPTAIAEISGDGPFYTTDAVILSGMESFDPDGTIELFEWDTDWGAALFDPDATGPSIVVTWDTAGEYDIQLRVTDDDGATDMLDEPLHVVIENSEPLVDEISAGRTTSLRGSSTETVSLQCVAHDPDQGDTLEYKWYCEAGVFESDTSPTAIWSPPDTVGKFYITCTVTDNHGADAEGQSPKIRVTQYHIMPPAPAQDFTCERLVGSGTFQLSDYCPGNVTLVVFWLTACGASLGQMPELQEVDNRYEGEDYAHLMISLDGNKTTAASWINSNSYEFTEWGWDNGSIFAHYNDYNGNINGVPQMIIIDADGNVRYAKLGAIADPAILTVVIDELI